VFKSENVIYNKIYSDKVQVQGLINEKSAGCSRSIWVDSVGGVASFIVRFRPYQKDRRDAAPFDPSAI